MSIKPTRRGLLGALALAAPALLLRRAEAQFGGCLPNFCKMSGCAVGSSDTWNPADKTPAFVLSNGNKTVTSTNGGPGGVRTVGTHTSGKRYIEITATNISGNIFDGDGIGIVTGTQPLTSIPGGASFWVRSDGLIFIGPTSTGRSINDLDGGGAGDIVGFAINLDTQLMWARNDFNIGNAWQGAIGGAADPATGLNGFDVSSIFPPSTAVYPCMTGDSSTTDVCTFNQTLVYAPPAGFCPW